MFNGNTVLNKYEETEYVSFPILSDTDMVYHGFSTRKGGVSKEIYSTMNLSLKLDDDRENVLENIKRFSNAVGVDYNTIVMSNQTHSNKIRCVGTSDMGTGIYKPAYTDDVDALVTNVKGLTLMTFYADCVPVFFLDESNKVIALAHSGWRGTYDEISKNVIDTMKSEYASVPEKIKVVTGPCICKSCYEVSLELGEKFAKKFGMLTDCISFGAYKCHLDLSRIIEHSLISCGVMKENIVVSDICTCCNSELFHSHRATNGRRGLNAALLSLKE